MSTGGNRTSERMKRLKEDFMQLHEEGYSVYEIAQMYGVHATTVYARLEEIAQENGVTREDLLREVHKTPVFWERQTKKLSIDVESLILKLDEAKTEVEKIQTDIQEMMEMVCDDDKEDFHETGTETTDER